MNNRYHVILLCLLSVEGLSQSTPMALPVADAHTPTLSSAIRELRMATPTPSSALPDTGTSTNLKLNAMRQLMDRYTGAGLPGLAIGGYDPRDGFYSLSSGYSRIEDSVRMKTSSLQYSQSITKTYITVALLQLKEKGRINLHSAASHYLPADAILLLPVLRQVTIRMLMNHSSGLPDYADDPVYVMDLLQHPKQRYTINDFLKIASRKKQRFAPGTSYGYCNLNTEILTLVIDSITGDHKTYLQENIFEKAGLRDTWYHNERYLQHPDVVDSYWDRYSSGVLENITATQKVNIANMQGDDGLVATPLDYVRFMKAVFEKQLINESSLAEMLDRVKGKDGTLHGGLGIFYMKPAGTDVWFHAGAGLGAGCILLAIPEKSIYLFVATNVGTITEGPATTLSNQFKDELLPLILQ